jgi:hypothetical protein
MKFDRLVDSLLLEMSVIRKSHLYTTINKNGENIIAAAIYDKETGYVYTGDSHYDAFLVMHKEEGYNFPVEDEKTFEHFRDRGNYYDRFIDGFYTDKDRFLNRYEALELMRKSKCPVKKDDLKYGKELHSNVVQDYQAACA